MSFGTVLTVNAYNRTVTVSLDNGQASGKNYKYPKNVTMVIGDRVLICNNAVVSVY